MPINDEEDILLNPPPSGSTPSVATTYTMTGSASSMLVGATVTITVTPVGGNATGNVVVTPSNSGGTGLSPTTLTFSGSSAAQTCTYTPQQAGTLTITGTNTASLTDPSPLTITVVAQSNGGGSSGSDPWATALPGSYPSGQAGYILGNLPVVPVDSGTVSASPTPTLTTFTATGNLNAPTGGYTAGNQCVFWTGGANKGQKTPITGVTVTGSSFAFTVAAMTAVPGTSGTDTFLVI